MGKLALANPESSELHQFLPQISIGAAHKLAQEQPRTATSQNQTPSTAHK